MVLAGDRELLDAFRAGERGALLRVYEEYVDLVFRVLRRGFVLDTQGMKRVPGVSDLEDAKEMAQEVFARAFSDKARAAYDGLSDYKPYLLRIAKNLMIDRLRKSGREVSSPDVDLGADEESAEQTEVGLDEQRLLAGTQAFVQALTDPEKTVFALRYQQGLGQRDVAAEMGLSRKRVRTIEGRLRQALHAHLKQAGLEEALQQW